MTASGDSENHPSIEARLFQLADRALAQTRAGVMAWRQTDDPAAFIFSGTKTSLIIDYYPRTKRYELRVINEDGRVVEELGRRPVEEVSSDDPWGAQDQNRRSQEYELFSNLHDAARRSAFDIDALLDSAFADVADPPAPPEPKKKGSQAPEEPPF